MLDIRYIRENAEQVQKAASNKGFKIDINKLLELDKQRREVVAKIEDLRAKRNELSQSSKGSQPAAEVISRGKQLKERLAKLEAEAEPLQAEYSKLYREVPNIIPDDTPLGGEEANRQERTWGDTADKDFAVIDHVDWGEKNDLLDFERGAKVAGSKFYFVKGSLAVLELAIAQLALDHAQKAGFTPMSVPHLVSERIIDGAGFSARSAEEEQIYRVDGEDLNLIATAEIPLTGYHADEILGKLPKLYVGYSPAYRKEAGAYGKHSRGLYRVHQFNKVEMYVFCKPSDSEKWHQKMVEIEESLCQTLMIPYRVVRIAAGDLGAAAYKKYDVEYWSPVDKAYHELMSCSNITDYQARRLNIRYRDEDGKTNFVHTLNGTVAAISRLSIAIIENFQGRDGKVELPAALQPYMADQTTL
ncbi:serine--tRNA ligase [Candidatus Saccharibacteria bacterium RIFCSPHIGHO2_12_FULL_48_21]|nr:MAG: serine--tRNA ligase [Candidatus Saccharibacteria bacterium RIFCSPHIGHO2_12_FULL_48_21]